MDVKALAFIRQYLSYELYDINVENTYVCGRRVKQQNEFRIYYYRGFVSNLEIRLSVNYCYYFQVLLMLHAIREIELYNAYCKKKKKYLNATQYITICIKVECSTIVSKKPRELAYDKNTSV